MGIQTTNGSPPHHKGVTLTRLTPVGFGQRQERWRRYLGSRLWAFAAWCTALLAAAAVLDYLFIAHSWVVALVPAVVLWGIWMWTFVRHYRAAAQPSRRDAL